MTLAAGSSAGIALRQATLLQPPEHREQEIDREQPNENYLPEAQVARRPMVGHHFRISIEESFSDAEDVGARHENDYQTDAEHDPQCQYRIAVRMDDCKRRKVHHRKRSPPSALRAIVFVPVSTGNPAFSRARSQCIKAVDPEMPRRDKSPPARLHRRPRGRASPRFERSPGRLQSPRQRKERKQSTKRAISRVR